MLESDMVAEASDSNSSIELMDKSMKSTVGRGY